MRACAARWALASWASCHSSSVANGVRLGRKQTLTYHQRQRQPSALKASKETHGEFGGSYNVSGWTFARLTARLP